MALLREGRQLKHACWLNVGMTGEGLNDSGQRTGLTRNPEEAKIANQPSGNCAHQNQSVCFISLLNPVRVYSPRPA